MARGVNQGKWREVPAESPTKGLCVRSACGRLLLTLAKSIPAAGETLRCPYIRAQKSRSLDTSWTSADCIGSRGSLGYSVLSSTTQPRNGSQDSGGQSRGFQKSQHDPGYTERGSGTRTHPQPPAAKTSLWVDVCWLSSRSSRLQAGPTAGTNGSCGSCVGCFWNHCATLVPIFKRQMRLFFCSALIAQMFNFPTFVFPGKCFSNRDIQS